MAEERHFPRTILSAALDGSALTREGLLRLLADSFYTLMERQARAHEGELFRKEGEAVWCSFKSSLAALQATIAVQEELHLRPALKLRAGLHAGEVALTPEGDVLGHALSVAKRLETACPPGQIHLSEEVYRQVAGRGLAWDFHDLGTLDLKGVGATRAYRAVPPERHQAGVHRLILGGWPSSPGWEREVFRLAVHHQGFTLEEGFALLPLEALQEALQVSVKGTRKALLAGHVLVHQDSAYGEALERITRVLQIGLEPDLTLVSETLLPLLTHPENLEPYADLPTAAGLFYRLNPCPPQLTFAQHPRMVVAPGPVDLLVAATPELDREELTQLEQSPHVLLPERTRQALEDNPEAQLPVAIAALASAKRLDLPDGLITSGTIQADGTVTSSNLPIQTVSQLEEWLLNYKRDERLLQIRREPLALIVAGPAGGEKPPYEPATDEEEDPEALQEWARKLPPSDLKEQVQKLQPSLAVSLFPDPRHDAAWLKLGGTLEHPRLTESSLEALFEELKQLPPAAAHALRAHTLLLLAWPETEELARWFLRHLRLALPPSGEQRAYLACPAANARWWEKRGVQLLPGDPGQLVRSLAGLSPEKPEPTTRALSVPTRPYKFLDYFEPHDRAIFFGREEETERLLARITASPALVLYGRSGVGKTSLLRAGVLSCFPRPHHLVLSLRCLSEPVQLIRQAVSPLLEAPELSLRDLLERVAQRLTGRVFLVLDQFEEFFVRLKPADREPFQRELAGLLERPPERVHVVLSLREDFLAELEDAVMRNRFRLTPLTLEQARQAIVGPAQLFGLAIEDELVDTLLQELCEEGVDPPELQIVLDRLYPELTLKKYRKMGGVKSILVDYLRASLQPGDRDVLGAMVTPFGTKAVVTGEVADAERLERLVRARLIRSFTAEEGGEPLYELAHEYLIAEVLSWATEEELAVRHAQMVLRSELENWERFGLLIQPERLDLIAEQRARLSTRAEERALLLHASALHGRALEPWLADAEDHEFLAGMLFQPLPGEVKRRIVRQLLEAELSSTRVIEAALTAAREVANPHLLAPGLPPARHRALQEAIAWRFFGAHRMVYVPPGAALLGSTQESKRTRMARCRLDQASRIATERELQAVDLADFWIDRCLVTNDEFAEFKPSHRHRYPPEQGRHPAVYVSWYEAGDYAAWLGKELPSEEQWEKAARGEDGRAFPWGLEWDPGKLNASGRGTTPVDSHPQGASPYGCLHMAGNVREWTASPWAREGPFKTQKGGSTVDPEPLQHCSTRFEAFPDFIMQWVGFRTAGVQPGPPRTS